MLKLWENPMLSIEDRLSAADGEIDRLRTLLDNAAERDKKWFDFALAAGKKVGCLASSFPDANDHILRKISGEPVEFLLNGSRLKLSFQQITCEECGHESDELRCEPLSQYVADLQGQWVALVPAENDRHLKMQTATPNSNSATRPEN